MSGLTDVAVGVSLQPERALDLTLAEWEHVLASLRNLRLLSRLAARLQAKDLIDSLPPVIRPHLRSALIHADAHAKVARWEIEQIGRALQPLALPAMLLKGTSYALAGLPMAAGRLMSDVDVMVPRDRLDDVQAAMRAAGWTETEDDERERQHFTEWLHQIPAMRHQQRRTTVDIHHTISPPGGLFPVDTSKLLAAAETVPGADFAFGIKVPSPEDMILITCCHLARNIDVPMGLRDLLDIRDLMAEFTAASPDFGTRLLSRAADLKLERPLHDGLRQANRLLAMPLPADLEARMAGRQQSWPLRRLKDTLYRNAMAPAGMTGRTRTQAAARWLLYVRALRVQMPFTKMVSRSLTDRYERLIKPKDETARAVTDRPKPKDAAI